MTQQQVLELIQQVLELKNTDEITDWIREHQSQIDITFFSILDELIKSAKENNEVEIAEFLESFGAMLYYAISHYEDSPRDELYEDSIDVTHQISSEKTSQILGPSDFFNSDRFFQRLITAYDNNQLPQFVSENHYELNQSFLTQLNDYIKHQDDKNLITELQAFYLRLCYEIGTYYYDNHNFEQAIVFYKIGLDYARLHGTIQEIGIFLNNLGLAYWSLTSGDREENLADAIRCYRECTRFFTKRDSPLDYAMIMNNLGFAMAGLSTGNKGKNLLESIRCYKEALDIYTEEDFPFEYAQTMNNLGMAYFDLPTGDRDENLQSAIRCYESALKIRTEKDSPFDYAVTMNCLGIAYSNLTTGNKNENLNKAIKCYKSALKIFTEKEFPNEYATTMNSLGVALYNLSGGDRNKNLEEAVECHKSALKIYTKEKFPVEHALTLNLIGLAVSNIHTINWDENLKKAIICYKKALEIYEEKGLTIEYADTMVNLGYAIYRLPTGNKNENLNEAIRCYNSALKIHTEKDSPSEYAIIMNNLGLAYWSLRTGSRIENLNKAIYCYNESLKFHTEKDFPVQYAMVMNNLGLAFSDLPINRSENLSKAIYYYKESLKIRTKEDFPNDYATTIANLGSTYYSLPTGNREENLYEAIRCYKESLKIRTEECFPLEYGETMHNLGNAYYSLPTGSKGENLSQAIKCYESALRIRTEDKFPIGFAETMNSLASAYLALPTGDRNENLSKSIKCYESALRIYNEKDYPFEYSETINNLGNVYYSLPTGDRNENLLNAIKCYEKALKIRTEENFPFDYAMTMNNLGAAYWALPSGDKGKNLSKSIRCYESALKIYTEKDFPIQYATAMTNIASIYFNLFIGDRSENLHNAIKCCNNALRIFTEKDFPFEYAVTMNNLANIYQSLPTDDKKENLYNAVRYYKSALNIFSLKNFPLEYAGIMNNLSAVYLSLSLFDEAIECCKSALKVYNKEDFPIQYAFAISNLANAYQLLSTGDRKENLKEAINCYKSAIEIQEQMHLYEDLKKNWYNLTTLYDESSDIVNAYQSCKNCISAIEKERLQFVLRTTKEAQTESNAYIYRKMVRLCIERAISERNPAFYESALLYAESSKSQNLVEKMIQEDLRPSASVPPELRLKYEQFILDLRRLEGELLALSKVEGPYIGKPNHPITRLSDYQPTNLLDYQSTHYKEAEQKKQKLYQLYQDIDKKRTEVQEILDEIGKYDKEFPLLVSAKSYPISIREISELLSKDKKTTLIEIYLTDKGTVVFIIDKEINLSNTTLFIEPFNFDTLFQIVDNWLGKYLMKFLYRSLKSYLKSLNDENKESQEYHKQKELLLAFIDKSINLLPTRNTNEFSEEINLLKKIKQMIIVDDVKAISYMEELKSAEEKWKITIKNIGKILYKELWSVKDKIRNKSIEEVVAEISPKNIIFVPSSGLHLLPLHLIDSSLTNDVESYIMNKYEILYAPSIKTLNICNNRVKKDENSFFVVANPDSSLKFADDEVKSISKHFTNRKELWYDTAVKNTVCEQIGWGNYIHFSCHGTTFKEAFLERDMMSAGLLLANDESLRVADIFGQLRLPNAKYVILSACETGIVKLDEGDEYTGLPGAFLFAGSLAVISSLWAVDDFSTSLLMEKLYERIIMNKQNLTEALSFAQNWIMNLTSDELIEILNNKINQLKEDKSKKRIVSAYKDLKAELSLDYKRRPYKEPYYWAGFFCSGVSTN